MAQIQRISHTHDQLMNWLISNPEASLRDCADYFGYSQGWLSQIIHSDVFQAKLRERQDDVFIRVADGIPAKLSAMADVALGKVTEALERSDDGKFALDVFDKAMHRLGYAPNTTRSVASPGVVQQNNFFISKSDLADARLRFIPATPAVTDEIPLYEVPSPGEF
jgi:hypothetical protein